MVHTIQHKTELIAYCLKIEEYCRLPDGNNVEWANTSVKVAKQRFWKMAVYKATPKGENSCNSRSWHVLYNKVVKYQVCARGSIIAGRTSIPAHNFKEKLKRQPQSPKRNDENWNFLSLKVKSKTWDFANAKLIQAWYPFDLPFCFEPYQKSYTLLKHRDLLACVFFCDSCETIGSDSLKAHHLYITKFTYAQTYDRCVVL